MTRRLAARDGGPARARRRLVPLAVSIAIGAALVAGVSPAPRAEEGPRGVPFADEVRPLLERHCVRCHGPKARKGQADLSTVCEDIATADELELGRSVVTQLEAYTMPPPEAPAPSDAERERLAAWFREAVKRAEARMPPDPGRVVLHRLNRVEYDNTIRDLIGLDLHPAEDFPPDDVAHGFDNVADVLSVPPLLMEKYLDAAERVLDRAILPGGVGEPFHRAFEGADLTVSAPDDAGAGLALEREVVVNLDIPSADEYDVRIRAWRGGEGDEPATLVVKLDGIDTEVFRVAGTRERPDALEASLPVRDGRHRLAIRHTWHTANPPKGERIPAIRLGVDAVDVSGPRRMVAHRRLFFVEPGGELGDREGARRVVERFATRAYRRPALPEEVERLLSLYDDARAEGKPFVEAVRPCLAAILVSPHFLFRVERDESHRDAQGICRLNDWELASRLSYFLWSTMPDDELFELAARGRLDDPEVRRRQVRRMLADPRSRALVENFTGQWLGLRKLEDFRPDPTLFPAFDASLRRAMRDEATLFFEAVLREGGSLFELLDADWTFLNEPLARHYGVKGIAGPRMRRVELRDRNRGGVVTMAAVLAATSHPTRTNAVKRGKWVLEEILGAPPPPPPPNVPPLEEPPPGGVVAERPTLRDRLERHRADPKCAGCHVRMDALGLGLENFDALGRWRDAESGRRIDAAGTLPGGESFADPAELKGILGRHREEFARAFVEKLLVYALGRGPEPADRREIDRIAAAVEADGWRLSTLVEEIVESLPFRYRRAGARPAEE